MRTTNALTMMGQRKPDEDARRRAMVRLNGMMFYSVAFASFLESTAPLDTARLTTDRPRARFSCMTDSFTSASLHFRRIRHPRLSSHCPRSEVQGGPRRQRSGGLAASSVRIFSLSSHSVITIIMVWRRWTVVLGRA